MFKGEENILYIYKYICEKKKKRSEAGKETKKKLKQVSECE